MELMQLEMLVATVEEGGMRKAAGRVSRTQAAVSMALRKLEEEMGSPNTHLETAITLEEKKRLLSIGLNFR